MRTTITVPDDLFAAVRESLGNPSPSQTVTQAFREFIRQRKIRKMIAQAGKVDLDLTQEQLQAMRSAR
jgi:Arc/MetJ family transcription regulator